MDYYTEGQLEESELSFSSCSIYLSSCSENGLPLSASCNLSGLLVYSSLNLFYVGDGHTFTWVLVLRGRNSLIMLKSVPYLLRSCINAIIDTL